MGMMGMSGLMGGPHPMMGGMMGGESMMALPGMSMSMPGEKGCQPFLDLLLPSPSRLCWHAAAQSMGLVGQMLPGWRLQGWEGTPTAGKLRASRQGWGAQTRLHRVEVLGAELDLMWTSPP